MREVQERVCYELNCVPSKDVASPNPVPGNVTLFGKRVFTDDQVKMGS